MTSTPKQETEIDLIRRLIFKRSKTFGKLRWKVSVLGSKFWSSKPQSFCFDSQVKTAQVFGKNSQDFCKVLTVFKLRCCASWRLRSLGGFFSSTSSCSTRCFFSTVQMFEMIWMKFGQVGRHVFRLKEKLEVAKWCERWYNIRSLA